MLLSSVLEGKGRSLRRGLITSGGGKVKYQGVEIKLEFIFAFIQSVTWTGWLFRLGLDC